MFKIRLLILLLSSVLIFSCTYQKSKNKNQYSIGYIGGSVDGLLLKNLLTNHLELLDMHHIDSIYEIQTSIKHSSNLYVTNIDNTSDRKQILSSYYKNVINKEQNCDVFSSELYIKQFYVFASNDKFLSNQKAEKEIRKDNIDNLVKKLINQIDDLEINCL